MCGLHKTVPTLSSTDILSRDAWTRSEMDEPEMTDEDCGSAREKASCLSMLGRVRASFRAVFRILTRCSF